jgi:hypothetical protein
MVAPPCTPKGAQRNRATSRVRARYEEEGTGKKRTCENTDGELCFSERRMRELR